MKIKIPKKFNLGALNITVKLYEKGELDDAIGQYQPYTKLIQLDKSQSEDRLQEAFIHELVEVINNCYELELEHPKIQTLGMALADILSQLEGK